MDTLTGFQRDLLYIAAGLDHPSGQDVSDELEGYYEAEINNGRLYPNLDELVEDGFIEKGQLDRRTNYYEIPRPVPKRFTHAVSGKISMSTSNSRDEVSEEENQRSYRPRHRLRVTSVCRPPFPD